MTFNWYAMCEGTYRGLMAPRTEEGQKTVIARMKYDLRKILEGTERG